MFLISESLKSNHGFFTRQGGVSTGDYYSLNCGFGSGDNRDHVQQNRDIVLEHLGGRKLITAFQTHSDICHIVTGNEEKLEGDSLVTNKPGIAIGVLTADCAPILFEDRNAGVIGSAHAGWKGARFGVISSTLRSMESLGASEITAIVGPCIQKQCYEVKEDFLHVFATEGAQNGVYFTKSDKEGHYHFDLPAYIEMKLRKNGIENIEVIAEDTYSQPEKFYSFRRGTHEGKQEYGRLISAICL
jgi:polyphenol oxidase